MHATYAPLTPVTTRMRPAPTPQFRKFEDLLELKQQQIIKAEQRRDEDARASDARLRTLETERARWEPKPRSSDYSFTLCVPSK